MNEAMGAWFFGMVMLVWSRINRYSINCQSLVFHNPNPLYFAFLFLAVCLVSWQAISQHAGHTMIPMLFVLFVIMASLGVESVYNNRSWTGGIWQYQIVAVFVFLGVMLKTLIDIFTHEFVHYGFSWIPADQMEQDLRTTLADPALSDLNPTEQMQVLSDMTLGSFLRCLSGIGVLCSVFCAGVVVFHFCELVIQITRADWTDKFFFRNLHSLRPNLVLQIVLLPLVFVLLSLRSMVRVIRIVNGTILSEKVIDAGLDWESALAFNESMFDANLELASAAEVWTILCLCFLCLDILKQKVMKAKNVGSMLQDRGMAQHDPGQHLDVQDVADTLRKTSLQGVVSFVVVGMLKATVALTKTLTQVYSVVNHKQCEHDLTIIDFACLRKVSMLQKLQDMCDLMAPMLQPLMILTSLQCIWNMMSICGFRIKIKFWKVNISVEPFKGMQEFREHDFDKKLTGVRILILILQMQKAVLKAGQKLGIVKWSDMQIRLAHSSLICIECLAVALMQRVLWKWVVIDKLIQQGFEAEGRLPAARKIATPAKQPLLS